MKLKCVPVYTVLAAVLFASAVVAVEPESVDRVDVGIDEVFVGFQNPPAEARPFVRWWWNGNQVEAEEILRELDVLKAEGFGGVEINPIAKPPGPESKAPVLTWRSEEWDRMLHVACKGAKERGMIADVIAGSGWPFGGEFLKPEQQIMRVTVLHDEVAGPVTFRKPVKEVLSETIMGHGRRKTKLHNPTLEFVVLMPKELKSIDQVRVLDVPDRDDGVVTTDVPAGEHVVAYGVMETGFRQVVLGAKGAMGPTMDHMQRSVTRAYLNRLKGVEKTWGEPLSDYIRAVFCDSIETSAANWTHDMLERFEKRKGYDVKPYLPLVMKRAHVEAEPTGALQDTLRRVRYDWNEHVVAVFLESFTREYREFCHDNQLLSRYQAYGTPYLMGMAEGYMIPDIPESNNWLDSMRSKGDQYYDEDSFQSSYDHGYMVWTKYTSAGGRLRGKKIMSTEAMTKTRKVFNTTLGKIKQADDVNFIAGMTHSVLHGFNYTPPDVRFPGWMRFGAYFSEHNTWWPYVKLWIDYNARLSHVFQATAPVGEIALMGPTPDLWSTEGLVRDAFHNSPIYFHRLWETISQLGGNCDYLHGAVIEGAEIEGPLLRIGPMTYKALIVAEMESMLPGTAEKIRRFARTGGRVIYVKHTPERSPGFMDAEENDLHVKKAVAASLRSGAKLVEAPAGLSNLRSWMLQAMKQVGYRFDLEIKRPRDGLYHLRHHTIDEDVLFFANTYREESSRSRVSFNLGERGLWKWCPETGERVPYALPYDQSGFLIDLRPLESVLLVTGMKETAEPAPLGVENSSVVDGPWKMTCQPAQAGEPFTVELDALDDFSKSGDTRLKSFSGTISYSTTFALQGERYTHLELGADNDFISEIWLNGAKLGVNWYGIQRFSVGDCLREGQNELRIEYTTTLNNMMAAMKGVRYQPRSIQPSGLMGPIRLLELK